MIVDFAYPPPALELRGANIVLHLFLDDSGKESQQTNPFVCMAGYLADHDTLAALYGEWARLLLLHKISEIHMKRLIPITGQYAKLGWDVEKRDTVVAEFVAAINKTKMFGLGAVVEVAAWRRQKQKYPNLPWNTAHQFCLERMLSRTVLHLEDMGVSDTLALVFDTDPDFGVARFNTFCALMGHDPRAARCLTSITFGHPVYYPGLQAADLLVWETRKELMQKKGGYESTKRWRALFTQMPHYHLEYIAGEHWDNGQFDAALPEIVSGLSAAAVANAERSS